MATNYVQDGSFITVTAGGTITAGSGVLVGSLFGVAQSDATSGGDVVLGVEGVWNMVTAGGTAGAFSAGAEVYFDATAGVLTNVTSGNTKVGVAIETVDGTTSLVKTRLNESF